MKNSTTGPVGGFKNKEAGMTLVELGFGLVILALVAAFVGPIGYKYLKNTEGDSAAKTTESYFTDLAGKLTRPPFTALDNDFAIDAKIPHESSVSGSTIFNYWGNSTVFASGTLTGGATNGAKQITDPVDPFACLRYVTYVSNFLDEVIVGSTTVKAPGAALDPAAAASACDVSTASVNVIMRKS
ncbi:type II secretion system protein [Neptuniibacter halophilus]|uniref:type II secretion system protein n=1 Tax=Neptuniibacter halophilus TaxID=651666 RepID=UPI0025733623|nr:type II secretion system protein [Neptuniibacter halophilus]